MATASSSPRNPVTFSAGSIELRDHIRDFVSRNLREAATRHAQKEGREQVTDKDVLACLDEVVQSVIAEFFPKTRS